MSDRTPAVPERVTQLAADALNAAIDDDISRASKAVKAISDEAGGEGLGWAVTAWCDTLILHYRRATGTPGDAIVQPGWQHADTGEKTTDPGDVPAEARWAGRVIAARAALDHTAYDALFQSLPEDGAAVGDHVTMLLSMAGLTLRSLLEGMS